MKKGLILVMFSLFFISSCSSVEPDIYSECHSLCDVDQEAYCAEERESVS